MSRISHQEQHRGGKTGRDARRWNEEGVQVNCPHCGKTIKDDKSKVAILATKQDLEDMIFAMTVLARSFAAEKKEPRRMARYQDLAAGMRQLSEAFPPNTELCDRASKIENSK